MCRALGLEGGTRDGGEYPKLVSVRWLHGRGAQGCVPSLPSSTRTSLLRGPHPWEGYFSCPRSFHYLDPADKASGKCYRSCSVPGHAEVLLGHHFPVQLCYSSLCMPAQQPSQGFLRHTRTRPFPLSPFSASWSLGGAGICSTFPCRFVSYKGPCCSRGIWTLVG